MMIAGGDPGNRQPTIVPNVLGYDCSPFRLGECKNPLVRGAAPGRLVNRDDIVPARPQLLRDDELVHFVDQELQDAARRMRASRSAASASSSFRRIHSSISSRWVS